MKEKFKDLITNIESEEKEVKEIYLDEVLAESKNKLSEYFPTFFRNIPTKLNYQDNSEELKINYHFEDDNLNINIKTTENLSDKTVDDLKKSEGDFLVFENTAENETILKKTQDFFFLTHEYIHGNNQVLLKEYRPDIIQTIEERRKEFEEADEVRKKELQQEERNSIFPVLGESLPISLERIVVEKILQDENMGVDEKNNSRKFWENHEKSFSKKKLEDDQKSKYSELDEMMIYYKIYQQFGEKGILDFIKTFEFKKLSKIKRYINPVKRILSEEYKRVLDMNASEFMKKFTKITPDRDKRHGL